MNPFQRCLVGGLGGFAALLTKYLSQHHAKIESLLENGQGEKAWAILFGLLILGAILIFLGGLIGWASRETVPLKLLALGISAPAMITTWSANTKPELLPTTAPPEQHADYTPPSDTMVVRAASTAPMVFRMQFVPILGASVFDGIKEVLGVDRIERRYWVIVASEKSRAAAEQLAAKINQEDPTMLAFVGKRKPDNEYYPVIVGDFVELKAAIELQKKAINLDTVDDAYLSDFADRKP